MNLFTRYPELRKIIINLKSGTALRGLMYRHAGRYLVLREADLLQSLGQPGNGKAVKMDGEVLVLSADIDFIQVVS